MRSRNFTAASSQYMDGANPGFSSGDYSVAIWFYTTDVTTNRVIASYRSTSVASRVGFQMDVNAGSARWLYGTEGSVSADSLTVTASTWHLFVGTRSGNTGRIYIDTRVGSGFTDSDRPTVNSLNIGAIVNGSSTRTTFWNGMLAEFTWWDGYALTAGDVSNLWRGWHPTKVRGDEILIHHPLDGRYGANDWDASFIGTRWSFTQSGGVSYRFDLPVQLRCRQAPRFWIMEDGARAAAPASDVPMRTLMGVGL